MTALTETTLMEVVNALGEVAERTKKNDESLLDLCKALVEHVAEQSKRTDTLEMNVAAINRMLMKLQTGLED